MNRFNIICNFCRVIVNFNVNHTVDSDEFADVEVNPNMDKPAPTELKSKPRFDVDIQFGDQTLSFACSFMSAETQQTDEYSE